MTYATSLYALRDAARAAISSCSDTVQYPDVNRQELREISQRINILIEEAKTAGYAQEKRVRVQIEDETEILQRLADGDTIVFSLDGDMAWFTKGDRAFVGNAIMALREKGYLLRKRDAVDDDDDPRGIADYDTISASGRASLTPSPDFMGEPPALQSAMEAGR